MTDDPLPAAFHGLAERAVPIGDCPTPEALWDAACGGAGPAAVTRVVDHVDRCAPCLEAWRLAVEMGKDLGPAHALPVAVPSRPTPWLWWAGGAAVALAAALLLFVFAVPRGREELPRLAPLEVRSLTGAELSRGVAELRWTEIPDGRYAVVVEAGGRTVDEAAGLDAPRHRIAPEKLSRLDDGARLVWRVTVETAAGARVRSADFQTTLVP